MKFQYLLLGGGLLAALSIAGKARGAKKLEFYPAGIDLSKLSLTNHWVTVKIEVVNPANVSQSIDAVFLNIFYGDSQVGRIQSTEKQTIPPLNSTILNLPTKLMLTGAAVVVADIVKGKKPEFTLVGTVNSMGVSIPINQKISM